MFTLLSFGILIPILSLILLGAMIAYLVRPLALKIKPYVKFETLAIFLAMILLAAPIVILIYFTAVQILLLASDIAGALPSASNSTLTSGNATLEIARAQNLGSLDNMANELIAQIGKLIGQFVVWLAGQIITTIAYIPSLFTDMIILLFSIFYFAKDGDRFVQFLKDMLPKEETFQKLYVQVDDILKSIMIVNIVCAVLLGLLSVLLYYILGYPYILLLGIVTAFSEFVPVVGPWVVYGALGIVDIITGNYIRGIVVIVFGWLIDTVVDMYIRPRLAGKYTEVHPLVFLVGFLFGAITLGLPGLFIGPLIVGIASVLYHLYRDEKIKGNMA
ncbi:AI-2E family transporter [Methanobacterium sp. CWC-01]|uniref:AI-2E family transporter n=1 Tax=Methanobacterium aridiramus TaxID=2584467 RepID=UPI002577D70A|nr:AI-2E family transporter [Methanobacterium sp. CWC-01]